MKTVLIAGAGQIGSRHLQGVKSSAHELDIWVYDFSIESLATAEDRYNQITTDVLKNVHFVTSLDSVPKDVDIAIIASSSKPRYAIITQLLSAHCVRYMILEKFLFPRISDYSEISQLLDEKAVTAWVNCPRRMWDGYAYIKTLINTSSPVEYSLIGGEWGMCCNTIHFLDIFMYLNEERSVELNIDDLEPNVFDSKRSGYVEIYGTELFTTPNDSILKLTSTTSFNGESYITIKNGNNIIKYHENKGVLYVNDESVAVPIHYQSGLSGVLVDELIASGECRLTTYAESSLYHVAYLKKIAPFINKIKGWTSDSCPIT